jgi:hypothetical protein
MTLRGVAGAVASALRAIGYDPVVVGGSAATINAPEVHLSDDIDMVVVGGIEDKAGFRAVIEGLGFLSKYGTFVHPESRYTLEFVPSPVAIGSQVIREFRRVETDFGYVRVLKPTDVVADRLNKYVVWHDYESFVVALGVARACGVTAADVRPFVERHAVGIDRDDYINAYERFDRAVTPLKRSASPFRFNTAFRVRFKATHTEEFINETAAQIRRMLDERRDEIVELDSVESGGDVIIEQDRAIIVLRLGTRRDLAFVEKLRLAFDAVSYLRANPEEFDTVAEIFDDGAPSIATVGF